MLESIGGGLGSAAYIGLAPTHAIPQHPWKIRQAIFRLECNLPVPLPAGLCAKLRISAEARYRLYINGSPIVSGPCKGDRWNHFYETLDITDKLVPGPNALAVRVVSFPPLECGVSSAGPLVQNPEPFGTGSVVSTACDPCLIVDGAITALGKTLADLTTGQAPWTATENLSITWKHCPDALWFGASEDVDMSQIPVGWAGIEPLAWPAAQTRWTPSIDPWGEMEALLLKERPIPLLFEKPGTFRCAMPHRTDGFPAFGIPGVIPPGETQTIELDAGELVTGYVSLNTRGGQGSVVKLVYAESYWQEAANGGMRKAQRDDWENGKIIGITDTVRPSGKEEQWESFWFRTFRFIRIEVTAGESPLEILGLSFIDTGYPLEAKTKINLPQPWLNKLWEVSLRTLQRCMHETYEDCPYYEQLQYTIDTRLQMLFTYAVSGDTRMARRTLWDYHCSLLPEGMMQSRYPCRYPQVIPVFSLYWVLMLEEYYIQTGDPSLVQLYRSSVDAVLDFFDRHIGALGLVENLGFWDFCDWSPEWMKNHGVPNAVLHGPAAVHNLVYSLALQCAARMSDTIGRPYLAAEYQNRAHEINRRVLDYCWDAGRGMLREGPSLAEFSRHTQTMAVLSGALDGTLAKEALRNARGEDVLTTSFAWTFMEMRAYEKCGIYNETYPVWSRFQSSLAMGLTTLPETPADENPRSDCHAWSAVPLYEFTHVWLGVRPGTPGWKTLLVQPHPIRGVTELQGEVTTPHGPANVAWKITGNRFFLRADLPAVHSIVRLPDNQEIELQSGGHVELECEFPEVL